MKSKIDLVKAWIEKAEHDLISAKYLLTAKPPVPDSVCFHAQQCAEKYLKAYLTFNEVEFRKTHDVGELIALASKIDKEFLELMEMGEKLTDYAVNVRYPLLFEEPTIEEAKEAVEMAEKIKAFVLKKLPIEVKK